MKYKALSLFIISFLILFSGACSSIKNSKKIIFDCNEVIGSDYAWVRKQIQNDVKERFKHYMDFWISETRLRLDDEKATRVYPVSVTSSGGNRYIVLYQFDPQIKRCRGLTQKFIKVIPQDKT